MAVRVAHPQPLAPVAVAVTARHVGRRPGLVDEHQPRRIKVELAIEPILARTQDVGAILLDRVPGPFDKLRRAFFARDVVSGEEAVQRRDRHRHARLAQLATLLVQRDVAPCFVQRQHRLPMRFDPPRPRVPALWLGGVGAGTAALVVPANHRRGRHTEAQRRSPATHPLVNRGQRP